MRTGWQRSAVVLVRVARPGVAQARLSSRGADSTPPRARRRQQAAAAQVANADADTDAEWQKNGTGRMDVHKFCELKI
jgi:hypothetical protein